MSQARQFYIELTSGAAAGKDFSVSDRPPLPAVYPDWVELPNGGTLTFIDGDGNQQTITGAQPGQRYPVQVRKIVTSTQTVRLGTANAAGLPGPVGPQGVQGGTWTVTGVKTANYGPVAGELVRCDTSGGGFTVTLPTAVGVAGQRIGVKDVAASFAAHNLTIAVTSAQTIDGAVPAALATNKEFRVYTSDGANWMIENNV